MSANHVGPDFCHTLGIPILRGRDVTDADTRPAPKVVLVTKPSQIAFSQGRCAGPFGRKNKPENSFTVVGVIGDSKYKRVDEKSKPTLYFPFAQTLRSPTCKSSCAPTAIPKLSSPASMPFSRASIPIFPYRSP